MSVRLSILLTVFLMIFPGFSRAQSVLTVAAASDLSALETDLRAAFLKNEPKVQVRFVTEASGVLTQQIENGAPYDVFMSANASFADRLASSGKLLPDSEITYAQGHLGVLWRDKKSHPLKDLSASWVRFIALPNPKLAPYGVAAQQALEHLGIWAQVQPKVVYGENVRQTLQLFDSGNADVVITSGSLLKDQPADSIPQDWHKPVIQKAGIVASTSHPELAQRFMRFLASQAGQAVFAKYGFGTPKP